MTPTALVLGLALSFAAMAALCLSMERHYKAAFLIGPSRRVVLALRIAGWAGIALSFAASVFIDGWNFGPVQWIGTLSAAALLVVALLAYRPRWLRSMALAAPPLALIVALAT